MRFPLKFLHWALVIGHWSLVAGTLAYAQPDTPKPARLRFLFLDETPGVYVIATPSGYRQVSSAPYEISSPFTPANLGRLDLYKTSPVPDPVTGETRRIKIASLTPPADTTAALVVVTPGPQPDPATDPVYRVELIDSKPGSFPPGSIRIINRGQAAMAARFGTDAYITAPGETRVVQPVTDARHRVLTKVAVQTPNGWDLLSDNITLVRPNERMIGIFVYSPSGLIHTYTASEIEQFGPPPPGHFWLTCSDSP